MKNTYKRIVFALLVSALLCALLASCQSEEHIHNFELKETKAATCTEDGYEKYVCPICFEEKVETIKASGHTERIEDGKEPTCTEDGYTAKTLCSVCGEVLIESSPIAALGHTVKVTPEIDSTCTLDGCTEGKVCEVCGEILEESKVIPAKGHKEEIIPSVEPTCGAVGYEEGLRCSVCGEYLLRQKPIERLPHTFTEYERFEETHVRKCSVCGQLEEFVIGNKSTFIEEKHTFHDGICSVCGYKAPNGYSNLIFRSVTAPDGSPGMQALYPIDNYDVHPVVPEFYSDCPVISVRFASSKITEITLPETVISIYCQGCSGLVSINIPSGVKKLNASFSGCSSLPNIVLPEGLTEIGANSFSGCSKLEKIIIPSGVKKIGPYAFSGCSLLEEIILPQGLEEIGANAFEGCVNLKSIIIPKSTKKIGAGVLANCPSLESITAEEGNARYVSLGNCLIAIRTKSLIAGCKNSVIPEEYGVDSIESRAFYKVTGLEEITIPSSVRTVCKSAFEDCTDLSKVTIKRGIKYIRTGAFANVGDLCVIEFEGSEEEWNNISVEAAWCEDTEGMKLVFLDLPQEDPGEEYPGEEVLSKEVPAKEVPSEELIEAE